ncbi:hypothetical protein BASA82_000049 [Batrachochytrium salamandrivorans]|nr:hypothetical protein BASA81_000320 [Batrachochytrium salamandrivorans]KAH9262934.1 hypothetical protein BASA82_000049 [Batrachochytrium salamandrivorans]
MAPSRPSHSKLVGGDLEIELSSKPGSPHVPSSPFISPPPPPPRPLAVSSSLALLPPLFPQWKAASDSCLYVKDEKNAKYYLVEVVEVLSKDDGRLVAALEGQPKALASLRRLELESTPLLLSSKPQTISQDDWVRVHYPGWSAKYDEWVCFAVGGALCNKQAVGQECHCERHQSERPLFNSKIRLTAGVMMHTRADLSPAFWKHVRQIKACKHM